jgi:hypothetical protein
MERLWIQPLRTEALPQVLERSWLWSSQPSPLVVRLVPEPAVPWRGLNAMPRRSRPVLSSPSWSPRRSMP